jgi:CubicO group peptidase (beta-lactamase class C family)
MSSSAQSLRFCLLAPVLALCFSIGVAALAPAAPANFDDRTATRIHALARDALRAWHVPGVAIAIVRDGEAIYLKGHGVRTVGSRDAVTADTLFPLASCTKAFTTAALAILVEEKKLGWDDPVRKHVPYFKLADAEADRQVVLRDLLCHRTGLGPHELLWYRARWPIEEAVRRAGKLPLDRPFRSTMQYQSTMFAAGGLASAAASGMPWEEFVHKRLLEPLQMKATVFTTAEAEKAADRATPHRLETPTRPAPMPFYPMEQPDPAGSMHSTARDLASWLAFQLGNGPKLVSRKVLAETHTPQIDIKVEGGERDLFPETKRISYGLGWVVHDYRGRKLIAHAGAIDGFRVQLTMVPEEKLGIVVLANLHHTRLNLALTNRLLDELLGLPPKDWNGLIGAAVRRDEARRADEARRFLAARRPNTSPSHELEEYAGAYEHPAYGSAHVRLHAGRLVWTWYDFAGRLEHFQDDAFLLHDKYLDGTLVTFRVNKRGVTGMKVEGRLGAEFRRK